MGALVFHVCVVDTASFLTISEVSSSASVDRRCWLALGVFVQAERRHHEEDMFSVYLWHLQFYVEIEWDSSEDEGDQWPFALSNSRRGGG